MADVWDWSVKKWVLSNLYIDQMCSGTRTRGCWAPETSWERRTRSRTMARCSGNWSWVTTGGCPMTRYMEVAGLPTQTFEPPRLTRWPIVSGEVCEPSDRNLSRTSVCSPTRGWSGWSLLRSWLTILTSYNSSYLVRPASGKVSRWWRFTRTWVTRPWSTGSARRGSS